MPTGKISRASRVNNKKEQLRKKLALKSGNKKLCLTMIVKNESNNINRLLDSLKSIVDMISIVDTGSTDNTKEVIEEWGKRNKIPTTVHSETFKDFAYNRTHSVVAAKAAYPDADYFLLSDADFVWEIDPKFNKALLVDHKYLVEQYNHNISYVNLRVLSAKVDWECVGLTHEYWQEKKVQSSYKGEIRNGKITTLRIHDIGDGGCKDNKFTRDEELLKRGLREEKDAFLRTRYKFYLAQTLKDTNKHLESIHYYEERIKDGGWIEEIFHAHHSIGINYERLAFGTERASKLLSQEIKTDEEQKHLEKYNPDNLSSAELEILSENYFEKAETSYTKAHKVHPRRAESLYALCRMQRIRGKNQQAYDIAMVGKKIKLPTDGLFLEPPCYNYLFDFELSIVGFYVNKDVGRDACVSLLQRDDLSAWERGTVESNAKFYI